ncbi:ubiquitin-specific protease doa4 [Geranomyces variabilis]|nr:ubiquitin-specific protease doa4 [Geranomyces variabilis]
MSAPPAKPRDPKELWSRAQKIDKPDTHSVSVWTKSAIALFEQGDQENHVGDLENAYIHLLRAISIVSSTIPSTAEYASGRRREDPSYLAAKRKSVAYLPIVEGLKKQLKDRLEAYEGRSRSGSEASLSNGVAQQRAVAPSPASAPFAGTSGVQRESNTSSTASHYNVNGTSPQPPPPSGRKSISAEQLLFLLKSKKKSLLVLDVRRMESFIHGHMKWRMAPEALQGGVVNLEPEWLESSSRSVNDIEEFLTSFGQSSATAKALFDSRHQFDIVVYLDDFSTSPDIPLFRNLIRILNQSPDKPLKLPPLLLTGGEKAWEAYVGACGEFPGDWIEIGEGCGRHSGTQSSFAGRENQSSGIARNPYDFVASRSQPNAGYIQKPAPAIPSRRGSDYDAHNPFQNTTNLPTSTSSGSLGSANGSASNHNRYIQASAPSRFNDPFFGGVASEVSYGGYSTTSDASKRMGMYGGASGGSSGRGFTPSYPQLAQNGTSALSPPSSSGIYPKPLPTPPGPPIKEFQALSIHQSQGYAPQPQQYTTQYTPPQSANSYDQNQNQNRLVPSDNYSPPLPVKASSPLLSRRPPMALDMTPPTIIRRSSSPSGSPSTARFYSTPPPLPVKPSLRQQNLPGGSLYSHQPNDNVNSTALWTGSLIGMAGIKNLGNTCFMSSVIQCLVGTVPLARYFSDGSYRRHINRKNPLGTHGEVADAFADLVKQMWTGQESNVITPTSFKKIIGAHHPSFRGNEQQDSQEFLAFLLDSLHEDLNVARTAAAAADKTIEPEIDEEGMPDEILLEKTWLKYRRRNWSIIVDLFQGSLKSRLECLTCHKTSTTFNPFMYLTLPIPTHDANGKKGGGVYIQECLDKFVEEEILDGDDAWRCPRCKVPRRSTKRLTIARLPVILLVHLKRFYFSGPFRDRVDTYVEFPIRKLDLTRYVPQTQRQEEFFYDLYGVSNHFGGLNGGHYTAQVRNGYKDNHWFNFDDARIAPTNDKGVKTPAAYILFYMRHTTGEKTRDNWWGGTAGGSRI